MLKLNKSTRAVAIRKDENNVAYAYCEYRSLTHALRDTANTVIFRISGSKLMRENMLTLVAEIVSQSFARHGRIPMRQRVYERVIVRPLCDVALSGKPALEVR